MGKVGLIALALSAAALVELSELRQADVDEIPSQSQQRKARLEALV